MSEDSAQRNWKSKETETGLKFRATKTRAELIRDKRFLAETDYLTGLHNRRRFDEDLRSAVSNFERTNEPFCLVNLDLKRFKNINDTFGHDEGDKALKFFAEFLKDNTRGTESPYRIGGDEFMIILRNTENDDGVKFIDRLKENLEKQYGLLGDVLYRLNFNGSVRQWNGSDTIEEFSRELDRKMFEEKRK